MYKLPLAGPVSQVLDGLSSSLTNGDDDGKVISAIHDVFLMTWTMAWMPTLDNQMPCSTQRCLALYSLCRKFIHIF